MDTCYRMSECFARRPGQVREPRSRLSLMLMVRLGTFDVQRVTSVLFALVRPDNHVYQPLTESPCRAVSLLLQSHVSAHAELTWLLTCSTPVNWLERMIQFKEKQVKQVRNGRQGSTRATSHLGLLTKAVTFFRHPTVDRVHLAPHISFCTKQGFRFSDILRGASMNRQDIVLGG